MRKVLIAHQNGRFYFLREGVSAPFLDCDSECARAMADAFLENAAWIEGLYKEVCRKKLESQIAANKEALNKIEAQLNADQEQLDHIEGKSTPGPTFQEWKKPGTRRQVRRGTR